MARASSGSEGTFSGDRVEWYSAEEATVDRSVVGALDSRYANLDRSVVSGLKAEDADVSRSVVGVARVNRGTIRESTAGIVAGRSVACDEVRTFMLVSPVVRGEVHTWFDIRSAVAVGVGIALGRALLAGAGALTRPLRR